MMQVRRFTHNRVRRQTTFYQRRQLNSLPQQRVPSSIIGRTYNVRWNGLSKIPQAPRMSIAWYSASNPQEQNPEEPKSFTEKAQEKKQEFTASAQKVGIDYVGGAARVIRNAIDSIKSAINPDKIAHDATSMKEAAKEKAGEMAEHAQDKAGTGQQKPQDEDYSHIFSKKSVGTFDSIGEALGFDETDRQIARSAAKRGKEAIQHVGHMVKEKVTGESESSMGQEMKEMKDILKGERDREDQRAQNAPFDMEEEESESDKNDREDRHQHPPPL